MASNRDTSSGKDPQHRLRRLDQVWLENPIYSITTDTKVRAPILANLACAEVLVSEWTSASARYGWGIGYYVIMPDHVHFFASPSRSAATLSRLMQAWKGWTSKRIGKATGLQPPLWQSGFFDHVLRSFESYEEKSRYILENPVRAGLVERPEDWPFHGKVSHLHFGP
jgi:REP element-mobilizing transposase RayT